MKKHSVRASTQSYRSFIKLHIQIPIMLFMALLHSVYITAQSQQLDFEPNDFKMVVTPITI